MFFDTEIRGDRLPEGTVCLTYDDGPGATARDGPGPRTQQLGRYLNDEGIAATFFVVGSHARGQEHVLQQLASWGHLLGNHTWSHPGLVSVATSGGDVVGELERTDAVLRPLAGEGPIVFRPPFGDWRQGQAEHLPVRPTSVVADILNRSGRLHGCVGPVGWDIEAEDFACWQTGLPPDEVAGRYVAAARRAGRGIVLMHDSSEDPALRSRNRTYELTRLMVPRLKALGFRFAGLDEVPPVRSAVGVRYQIALHPAPGEVLARPANGNEITCAADNGDAREAFGVCDRGDGRVALRAGNGCYLRVTPVGPVRACGHEPGEQESLLLQPRDGGFVVRCAGGGVLAWDRDRRQLRAAGPECAATFSVERLFS
jgi:peptidoglycan/xylan/chitin deacetylase (PgdA/CDA1 family)